MKTDPELKPHPRTEPRSRGSFRATPSGARRSTPAGGPPKAKPASAQGKLARFNFLYVLAAETSFFRYWQREGDRGRGRGRGGRWRSGWRSNWKQEEEEKEGQQEEEVHCFWRSSIQPDLGTSKPAIRSCYSQVANCCVGFRFDSPHPYWRD